jgi:hypothetical protein
MSDAPGKSGQRWPIRHVAMSASHELYDTPAAALEATVHDRLVRRLEIHNQHRMGRSWCPYAVESTRLNRSIDGGIDDIKFLYPVLDNIPVLVFPLLNFARAGARLCLYGSPEICRVAELVRDYLLEIGWLRDRDDLQLMVEDRSRISFFHSFQQSTKPFALGADDAIVWSAADLVLAYDVWPWLLEKNIDDNDLIVNMIARQLIFAPGEDEFLRLEYFDSLIPQDRSHAQEVRQPDILVFTGRGRDGLINLAEIRGKSEAALLNIFLKNTWRGLFGSKAKSMLHAIHYGIKRKRYSLSPGEGITQKHASDFASVFFNVPTAVKAGSADPFIVKDADGFEEVFGYYRTLLQGVVDAATTKEEGYARLSAYYPHAQHLFQLSRRLQPLWSEIALWRRWPEFICDKTSTYNTRLSEAFKGAGVEADGKPIPEYFSADGSFRFHPSPSHSNIPKSLDFLVNTYLPRYQSGRRWHARLLSRC